MGLFLPTGGKPQEQESQHWYHRDGRPCYEQPTKGGGLRATNLRDARTLGLVPSVTTVLSVLAKPQLETWKVKQGILAALTLPRGDESDDDFLARVLSDSREQAKAAAEEGTRIHDACECAVKGTPYPEQYRPHVEAAIAELNRLFPDVDDWVAEASFGHPSGFGGKVDLHSPSTGIVCDYKGKDGDFSDGKKLAYDQHYQLAAYNRGLRLPPAECANIFVSRTHPGKVASHKWSRQDIDNGWAVFASALQLWKDLRGFDSSFSDAQAARPSEPVGEDVAFESWHAAVESAGELVTNAPDDRYRTRAEQVRQWIEQHRPAQPEQVSGEDGLPAGVAEALQRLIEDAFTRGPASADDARTLIEWRRRLTTGQGVAACEVCGRAVLDRNEPCAGFLAPCGRRLARLEDCGKVDCVEAIAATRQADDATGQGEAHG